LGTKSWVSKGLRPLAGSKGRALWLSRSTLNRRY
jgi:hypothetical protein